MRYITRPASVPAQARPIYGLTVAASAMLILLVFCMSIMQGVIHIGDESHFHGSDETACAAHSVSDPCHASIFHSGISQCGHRAHLYSTLHDCGVCDLLMNTKIREQSPVHQYTVAVPVMMEWDFPFAPAVASKESTNPLRGPPGMT